MIKTKMYQSAQSTQRNNYSRERSFLEWNLKLKKSNGWILKRSSSRGKITNYKKETAE